MTFIKAIIALVFSIEIVASGQCPEKPEVIFPCTCSDNAIICKAIQNFDLDEVFKAVANGRSDGDLSFDTFVLDSPKITKLEDNLFRGLKFKTLKFNNCDQLVCVNQNAFSGMEKYVEKFISFRTSFRWDINHADDCNLFNSLKRLTNLQQVNITGSRITEIPAEAFHDSVSSLQLVTIDLSGGDGGDIAKIGKNAFSSLKAVKYIDLSSHRISSIDSHGFDFSLASDDKLLINLENNNLTFKSFANDSFEMSGRITTIKLGANPLLQVLEEPVFRTFLSNKPNDQNQIDVKGSQLLCHHKNLWLLENKVDLKLTEKILNAISPDGRDFWLHTKKECASDKDTIKTLY